MEKAAHINILGRRKQRNNYKQHTFESKLNWFGYVLFGILVKANKLIDKITTNMNVKNENKTAAKRSY